MTWTLSCPTTVTRDMSDRATRRLSGVTFLPPGGSIIFLKFHFYLQM